ncbi:MAG TPA: hypothetical protein IGS53_21170 [Leptolyngbyaceae cyanobacterium M33_DOE_097]|uniref:Uncharacterized protein n=1 Tax=Oscillatoriales cyanobacterium SpSt-418 TaxID=2282169 RepID=A0A7C3KBA6_9CYAN|nr:hypothetical protein [Leptolyngbyaceae cyanobacterium M33_DOE_097]
MTGTNPAATGEQRRSKYARTPTEYAVHLLIQGGHREEVRFQTIQEFQKWYSGELVPKASSDDFITVPIKNVQGEYMVLRPSSVLGIRVEPVFSSSVERY